MTAGVYAAAAVAGAKDDDEQRGADAVRDGRPGTAACRPRREDEARDQDGFERDEDPAHDQSDGDPEREDALLVLRGDRERGVDPALGSRRAGDLAAGDLASP
jgi:hypothetical protein